MYNNSPKRSSRRNFIRNTSLATTLLFFSGVRKNNNVSGAASVSCGVFETQGLSNTISSIHSGVWSDKSVWGGKIPEENDIVIINSSHHITLDLSTGIAGLNIMEKGILNFSSNRTLLLKTTGNLVIEGTLEMNPASSQIIHTIRFTGINEDKFVGGGMNVLNSDIGIWVMKNGNLSLKGNSRKSWTRSAGTIVKDANKIILEDLPEGWMPGDELVITPTAPPGNTVSFNTGFEERRIEKISGINVFIDAPLDFSHPKVNDRWTAEIINLTRNVRLEGTATGRAHLFIRSSGNQQIAHTAIRYFGPRKDINGDGVKELVAGRYGLHFHHSMNGSVGSVIHGNVIRDCHNHSYVPHVSNGITFTDNIAYKVFETAFWWDPGDESHDIVYDHNIVANCQYFPRSINMNSENAPTFSSSGFAMNSGDDNICTNNVVVGGSMGDYADGGAYNWEAVLNEGIWTFRGNLAHNNDNGLRVWQNTTRNHVIEMFEAYHNQVAIFHGAYANSYTYNGGMLYGNGFKVKAASINSNRVRIENMIINGAGMIDYGIEIIHSPLKGERPVFIRNVGISGCNIAALIDTAAPEIHSVDLIHCDIKGSLYLHPDAAPGETIRVQPLYGETFEINKSGKSFIPRFAPAIWGDGDGLNSEYFNADNFSKLAFSRIDSNISFSEWGSRVHHRILQKNYSVRWTGSLMPQFTELHTFHLGSGGGHRLYINDKLIINGWTEHYPDNFTSPAMMLEAGKLYNLKLEYFNHDDRSGIGLMWSSASLSKEYIPQSQLFSRPVTSPPPTGTPGVTARIFNDQLIIQSDVNTTFQLFDLLGRKLMAGRIQAGSNQITINSFAKGILLFKLNNSSTAVKLLHH